MITMQEEPCQDPVFVELNGKSHRIFAKEHWNVYDLKEQIFKSIKISTFDQRLFIEEEELKDETAISELPRQVTNGNRSL
ncbi:MAG: hypothetical protein HC840_25315, partial [Leptolyngbyaceae cyanobacterium RM2_2_4]|nr:hypothetical protein [Leptolyngbyaceae cyanobacterium RM2_2_4]